MPDLNPYRDSDPWGRVYVGGVEIPGVITEINGAEKPEDWDVQKGTGTSGATTVWKGTKLAEAIEITTTLFDEDSVDAYHDLPATLRPKIGSKPPSFDIQNPAINFAGITRVACINIAPIKFQKEGLVWIGKVTLIEYNPSKKAKTGPADPAKPDDKKEPTENDKAAKELQDVLDQAAKV